MKKLVLVLAGFCLFSANSRAQSVYDWNEYVGFYRNAAECQYMAFNRGYSSWTFGSKHFVNACFGVYRRNVARQYNYRFLGYQATQEHCKAEAGQYGYPRYEYGSKFYNNTCFGLEPLNGGGPNPPPVNEEDRKLAVKSLSMSIRLFKIDVLTVSPNYKSLEPRLDKLGVYANGLAECYVEDGLPFKTCKSFLDRIDTEWNEFVPAFYEVHGQYGEEKMKKAFVEVGKDLEAVRRSK